MAAALDLAIYRGDTWTNTLTWKVGTSLVDLTGYTAKMEIRPAPGTTVIQELNSVPAAGKGDITLGGAEGTILLSLSATLTAALDFSTAPSGELEVGGETVSGRIASYDLQLTKAGVVTTLVAGKVCLIEDVTR